MYGSPGSRSPQSRAKAFLYLALAIVALVLCALLVEKVWRDRKQDEVERSNLDTVTRVVRESTNRIQVQRLSGTVTTVRETTGGPFGVFRGKLIIRQPFSVSYFVDMRQMGLTDYIWDEPTKTLRVRVPEVAPEAPNVDESRQEVAAQGWIITREMQNRLRKAVAQGAARQAVEEARKEEHLQAARAAARNAIAQNLRLPLQRAGLRDVRVEVVEAPAAGSERWDVSRSIEEVLEEAARNRR